MIDSPQIDSLGCLSHHGHGSECNARLISQKHTQHKIIVTMSLLKLRDYELPMHMIGHYPVFT